jgi:hypothetical protein
LSLERRLARLEALARPAGEVAAVAPWRDGLAVALGLAGA